jgi:hypothetical protein
LGAVAASQNPASAFATVGSIRLSGQSFAVIDFARQFGIFGPCRLPCERGIRVTTPHHAYKSSSSLRFDALLNAPMRILSWLPFVSLLPAVLLGTQTLPAALVDSWRADDLIVLKDGDAVGSWTSASNRTLTAGVGLQPLLKKNVTPAAGAAVRFNLDFLNMSANSPWAV